MNTEAMLAVADVIEVQNRFDLNYYATAIDPGLPCDDDLLADCNTVGCVAGWANALLKHRDLGDEPHAAHWLGLTAAESDRLFTGTANSVWVRLAPEFGWGVDEFDGYDESGGLSNWSEITAPQAADVLRRIARGEVEL